MRVEQAVEEPCGFCTLILELTRLSESDKGLYQRHLRTEHRLQPYYIHR